MTGSIYFGFYLKYLILQVYKGARTMMLVTISACIPHCIPRHHFPLARTASKSSGLAWHLDGCCLDCCNKGM